MSEKSRFFETKDRRPDGVEVIVNDRLDTVQITQGYNEFQMTLAEAKKFAEFVLDKSLN